MENNEVLAELQTTKLNVNNMEKKQGFGEDQG
jgi:hypothetical protein